MGCDRHDLPAHTDAIREHLTTRFRPWPLHLCSQFHVAGALLPATLETVFCVPYHCHARTTDKTLCVLHHYAG